jgi:hypothetical protein
VTMLDEVVQGYLQELANDLEKFARHAKRMTVRLARARSQCRSVLARTQFTPDSRIYSVPLFLNRQ